MIRSGEHQVNQAFFEPLGPSWGSLLLDCRYAVFLNTPGFPYGMWTYLHSDKLLSCFKSFCLLDSGTHNIIIKAFFLVEKVWEGCLASYIYIWVFPKIVVPQNGWFIRENPIRINDLVVPLFLETPIWCHGKTKNDPKKNRGRKLLRETYHLRPRASETEWCFGCVCLAEKSPPRMISPSRVVILKLSKISGWFFFGLRVCVATKLFDIRQQNIILQYMG